MSAFASMHSPLLYDDAGVSGDRKASASRSWRSPALLCGVAVLALSAAVATLISERHTLKAALSAQQATLSRAEALLAQAQAGVLAQQRVPRETDTRASVQDAPDPERIAAATAAAAAPAVSEAVAQVKAAVEEAVREVDASSRSSLQEEAPSSEQIAAATAAAAAPAVTDAVEKVKAAVVEAVADAATRSSVQEAPDPGRIAAATAAAAAPAVTDAVAQVKAAVAEAVAAATASATPSSTSSPSTEAEVEAPASGVSSEAEPLELASYNRKTYPPARLSVDPNTPRSAVEKYKHDGMSLVFSDEFKDVKRTKEMFVFETLPYGVPGNTGDINIVSVYTSEMVTMLPEGGLRLSCEMAEESFKEFHKGHDPNGTNPNYNSPPDLWTWKAPKVTSRLKGRFQFGMVEVSIKAPKGYGPWPAAWLNACYGFVSEASGEFLVQENYPFLCGQFWPPELDFFEHFSPEHTWYWRPNSMSVHSPNQYVGLGRNHSLQGGYCPTTLAPPGEAWCFGVSGAGAYLDDPTERYITYGMKWEPESVSYFMDEKFMLRFTKDQLVMYLSGQNRPILIPEVPMFFTFNIALVRKGMDASHMGPGLTAPDNFNLTSGEWKGMHMDIEWVRLYQDNTQGETRGLNPPITYETRKKLLANRVTCNLIPELRCLIKNSTAEGAKEIFNQTCTKLRHFGDHYCDTIDHLCSINNAANPTGTYGLPFTFKANMANQHLSLVHGWCCVDHSDPGHERAHCHHTPKSQLPKWLRESEYFKDPPRGPEGLAGGVAGTNPAGWKTYGRGLTSHFTDYGLPQTP